MTTQRDKKPLRRTTWMIAGAIGVGLGSLIAFFATALYLPLTRSNLGLVFAFFPIAWGGVTITAYMVLWHFTKQRDPSL